MPSKPGNFNNYICSLPFASYLGRVVQSPERLLFNSKYKNISRAIGFLSPEARTDKVATAKMQG